MAFKLVWGGPPKLIMVHLKKLFLERGGDGPLWMHYSMSAWGIIAGVLDLLRLVELCIFLALTSASMSAQSNNFCSLYHSMLRLVLMWVGNPQAGPLPFHLIARQAHHVSEIRFHSVRRLTPAHAVDRFTSLFNDVLKVLDIINLSICHLYLWIFPVHHHIRDSRYYLRVFSRAEFVRGLLMLGNDMLITLRRCNLLFTEQDVFLARVVN